MTPLTHRAVRNARKDYLDFEAEIAKLGIGRDIVRALVENDKDLRHFPNYVFGLQVLDSRIHGKGLFTTMPFAEGVIIAPARIGSRRTPAGRYVNHSSSPNAHMVLRKNFDLDLVTLTDISSYWEITTDYRETAKVHGWLNAITRTLA